MNFWPQCGHKFILSKAKDLLFDHSRARKDENKKGSFRCLFYSPRPVPHAEHQMLIQSLPLA